MPPNDDRRIADEGFRRELAERLKALEKSNDFLAASVDKLDKSLSGFKIEQLQLHYTLFGGPEADNVGLLERFRKMATRDKWIIWIGAALIGFGGKLVSPIYNRLISEWAMNSVSEKWRAEQSRPKVKHITYVIKNPPASSE